MSLSLSKMPGSVNLKNNLSKNTRYEKLKTELSVDTKLSLLMKSLTLFYKDLKYIKQIKDIVDQNSVISLRILDWFITNYAKKYRTIIRFENKTIDVYQNYKLQLKSYSKAAFDPFCRKNKIIFYYTEEDYIETSCGQLCFFRWCFENNILDYVKENLGLIEQDMKNSLNDKKTKSNNSSNSNDANDSSTSSASSSMKKRQPLSLSASRSVSKQNVSYTVTFD
jgi:hypothetical protein